LHDELIFQVILKFLNHIIKLVNKYYTFNHLNIDLLIPNLGLKAQLSATLGAAIGNFFPALNSANSSLNLDHDVSFSFYK